MRRLMLAKLVGISFVLSFMLGLGLQTSCAKAPPSLVTVQGVASFQNLQIVKPLDLMRDLAQDASRTVPPIITRADALKVTDFHTAAVKILDARGPDWKNQIVASADALLPLLSPRTQGIVKPYVTLVKTVLAAF